MANIQGFRAISPKVVRFRPKKYVANPRKTSKEYLTLTDI
jgi:hypothetical protein